MSDRTVAVIPFGALERAKTRLGAYLSSVQRQTLAVAMLNDCIVALQQAKTVSRIVVVGPMSNKKLLTLPTGATYQLEGKPTLNGAVAVIVRAIPANDAVLVIHADLPTLTGADVDVFVASTPANGVALAAAADGGTPAICSTVGTAWQWQFGPHSFRLHQDAAAKAGIPVAVERRSSLTLDVDTPEDIAALDSSRCGPQTAAFLATLTRAIPQKSPAP